MKIINVTAEKKLTLPKGKLSVRFSHSVYSWSCYIGGRYVVGGGETEDQALDELERTFDVPVGYRETATIKY